MLEWEDISPILAKVRRNIGIDFSVYHDGTLRRRLSRRLVANNCVSLDSYSCMLDSNPDEYRRLVSHVRACIE